MEFLKAALLCTDYISENVENADINIHVSLQIVLITFLMFPKDADIILKQCVQYFHRFYFTLASTYNIIEVFTFNI